MTLPATRREDETPQRPGWSDEQTALVNRTVARDCDNDELALFLHICTRTGLDPFAKQIYAIKRFDTALGRKVMTVQTAIDGYRLIAERTGKYAPGREPSYVYDDKGAIVSATAYVRKMTDDGTWHEVAATAFWSEYVVDSPFWKKMKHNQLAKCAEALALRKAFPRDLSGLYTFDEMAQADNDAPSGGAAPPALVPPRRRSEQQQAGEFNVDIDMTPAAPDDPASIEIAGEPEPADADTRLLTADELRSLMVLVTKSKCDGKAFAAWVKERFHIGSRKEIQLRWLDEIMAYLAIREEA